MSAPPERLNYHCSPISDWNTEVVWRAPARFGWDDKGAYDGTRSDGAPCAAVRAPFDEQPICGQLQGVLAAAMGEWSTGCPAPRLPRYANAGCRLRHSDSDFGSSHDAHPIVNRTTVEGSPATDARHAVIGTREVLTPSTATEQGGTGDATSDQAVAPDALQSALDQANGGDVIQLRAGTTYNAELSAAGASGERPGHHHHRGRAATRWNAGDAGVGSELRHHSRGVGWTAGHPHGACRGRVEHIGVQLPPNPSGYGDIAQSRRRV